MKFDKVIFDEMMEKRLIPENGTFIIDEKMKQTYVELYSNHKGNGTLKTSSNQNYAMKMAGLSLIKLNEARREVVIAEKRKPSTKSGILYLISNEAWPGYVKVGITKNLHARLSTYQTCDPFRRFKVEHYRIVEDARVEEKNILDIHKINISSGEWIKTEAADKIFPQ
jgi:hypothetical protein